MQQEPMTEFGYKKITTELEWRKNVERANIAKEIEIARAHGDLKENAEYHAAKEKQAINESRIIELGKIVSLAQVIEPSTLPHKKVSFGSTVRLLNLESEEEVEYTIVGMPESDGSKGYISYHSPLVKVLLGKEEGEEVSTTFSGNGIDFEILRVYYKPISFE